MEARGQWHVLFNTEINYRNNMFVHLLSSIAVNVLSEVGGYVDYFHPSYFDFNAHS